MIRRNSVGKLITMINIDWVFKFKFRRLVGFVVLIYSVEISLQGRIGERLKVKLEWT